MFLGTVFSVGKNGKLRWVDHGSGHEQRIHIIYICEYRDRKKKEKERKREREGGREGGEAEKDTEEKLVLCIYVYTLYIYIIYTIYIYTMTRLVLMEIVWENPWVLHAFTSGFSWQFLSSNSMVLGWL